MPLSQLFGRYVADKSSCGAMAQAYSGAGARNGSPDGRGRKPSVRRTWRAGSVRNRAIAVTVSIGSSISERPLGAVGYSATLLGQRVPHLREDLRAELERAGEVVDLLDGARRADPQTAGRRGRGAVAKYLGVQVPLRLRHHMYYTRRVLDEHVRPGRQVSAELPAVRMAGIWERVEGRPGRQRRRHGGTVPGAGRP